jgi:hypothetical protein
MPVCFYRTRTGRGSTWRLNGDSAGTEHRRVADHVD